MLMISLGGLTFLYKQLEPKTRYKNVFAWLVAFFVCCLFAFQQLSRIDDLIKILRIVIQRKSKLALESLNIDFCMRDHFRVKASTCRLDRHFTKNQNCWKFLCRHYFLSSQSFRNCFSSSLLRECFSDCDLKFSKKLNSSSIWCKFSTKIAGWYAERDSRAPTKTCTFYSIHSNRII